MTVLSDKEIMNALKTKKIHIAPFSTENLTSAGYDFSAGSSIELRPKEQKLISTSEFIGLDAQTLATIHVKSSLAREGISGSFAVIDPGFRGRLTLSLCNLGTSIVRINQNEPIVQIIFHSTGEPCAHPYRGRYQDSRGVVGSRRTKTAC